MQLFSITALRHAYLASTIKTSTYIVPIETRWDEWGLGAGGAGEGLRICTDFCGHYCSCGRFGMLVRSSGCGASGEHGSEGPIGIDAIFSSAASMGVHMHISASSLLPRG